MANLSALLGLGGGASEPVYGDLIFDSGLVNNTSYYDIITPITGAGVIDRLVVTKNYAAAPSILLYVKVTVDGGTPIELIKTITFLDGFDSADVFLNLKYKTSIKIEMRSYIQNQGYSKYNWMLTHKKEI